MWYEKVEVRFGKIQDEKKVGHKLRDIDYKLCLCITERNIKTYSFMNQRVIYTSNRRDAELKQYPFYFLGPSLREMCRQGTKIPLFSDFILFHYVLNLLISGSLNIIYNKFLYL